MTDEFSLLLSCLGHPADVCSLSHRFSPSDMRQLERLGFLARTPDRSAYVLTQRGMDRLVFLRDQAGERRFSVHLQDEEFAFLQQQSRRRENLDKDLQKRSFRVSWFQCGVSLLIGWVLGGFTFPAFLSWLTALFR